MVAFYVVSLKQQNEFSGYLYFFFQLWVKCVIKRLKRFGFRAGIGKPIENGPFVLSYLGNSMMSDMRNPQVFVCSS